MWGISSVQFSRSVVSDSLWPHESQHSRPPCPSPTPRVHSDSRPSSQWCHPTISSSVVPFSSCPQSFPASESFPMSQLFAWGGQSTGVSASASFLPKKSQGWSPSEWTERYSLIFPWSYDQIIPQTTSVFRARVQMWANRSIKRLWSQAGYGMNYSSATYYLWILGRFHTLFPQYSYWKNVCLIGCCEKKTKWCIQVPNVVPNL